MHRYQIIHSEKIKLDIDNNDIFNPIFYYSLPWIHEIVLEMLITSCGDNNSIISLDQLILHNEKSQILNNDGILWYKPNKYFYNLLSNPKIKKQQNQFTLILKNKRLEKLN